MKKFMSTVLSIVLFTSISSALIPEKSFIIDNRAYDSEYILNNPDAVEFKVELLTRLGNSVVGDVYYKLSEEVLYSLEEGKAVNSNMLPSITYYDRDGNQTIYGSGDGEPISEGFYIEDIK